MTRPNTLLRIFLAVNILILAINAVVGWRNMSQTSTQGRAAEYPLLAKRIFVDNPNEILVNFVPLRKRVEARLANLNEPYSFYFEYLPDGTSIRYGEDTELVAASLIKLPLIMNLYRAAELGRVDLNQTVEITEDDLDEDFGSLWKKGVGAKLTLRQAAELALKESDNTAMRIAYRTVVDGKLLGQEEESLSQLDIEYSLREGRAVISAKAYSSILKCLYYSCYLDWGDSQELLGFMSESSFDNRIAAPIPDNIKVAHKIGVYSDKLSESDCGIIYAPYRPYLLCVMVGLPEEQAGSLMRELSDIVYRHMTGR